MTLVYLWAPVVIQMALIFGASSLSDPGPLLPGGVSDKTGHFAGYALLSVLVLRALAGARTRGVTWRPAIAAVVFATLYGISDEYHQRFVPGRTPDVLDVATDFLGAIGGIAVGGLFKLLRGAQRRAPAAPHD